MRCLNCRTVLMDNDVRCPSCGAAAPLPSYTQPSSFEGPGGQPIGRVTPGKLGCGIVSLLAGGALLLKLLEN